MLPKALLESIQQLPAESKELLNLVILIYEGKLKTLEARVEELEAKVSEIWHQSSLPGELFAQLSNDSLCSSG